MGGEVRWLRGDDREIAQRLYEAYERLSWTVIGRELFDSAVASILREDAEALDIVYQEEKTVADRTLRNSIVIRYLDVNFDRASAQCPPDSVFRAEAPSATKPGNVYYGYGRSSAEALSDLASILSWVIDYYVLGLGGDTDG